MRVLGSLHPALYLINGASENFESNNGLAVLEASAESHLPQLPACVILRLDKSATVMLSKIPVTLTVKL